MLVCGWRSLSVFSANSQEQMPVEKNIQNNTQFPNQRDYMAPLLLPTAVSLLTQHLRFVFFYIYTWIFLTLVAMKIKGPTLQKGIQAATCKDRTLS